MCCFLVDALRAELTDNHRNQARKNVNTRLDCCAFSSRLVIQGQEKETAGRCISEPDFINNMNVRIHTIARAKLE